MRTIYKYEMNTSETYISLPDGAEPVKVDLDPHGARCIWVLLNPELPKNNTRCFVIKGTGHTIDNNLWYVGSFKEQPFVWHVFEKL